MPFGLKALVVFLVYVSYHLTVAVTKGKHYSIQRKANKYLFRGYYTNNLLKIFFNSSTST